MTGAFQVLAIGLGSPLIHLIAHAVKPRRLEAQRRMGLHSMFGDFIFH
jgi:hypothetical protein